MGFRSRGLPTGILVTLVAMPAAYALGLFVHPPVTADGHRVMPLGQVEFAVVLGPLLGVVAGIFASRGRRR